MGYLGFTPIQITISGDNLDAIQKCPHISSVQLWYCDICVMGCLQILNSTYNMKQVRHTLSNGQSLEGIGSFQIELSAQCKHTMWQNVNCLCTTFSFRGSALQLQKGISRAIKGSMYVVVTVTSVVLSASALWEVEEQPCRKGISRVVMRLWKIWIAIT